MSRSSRSFCSPPNVLWLQFCGDGDPCDESPIDDADVTWCRDKIFGADEMYIRAEHIMPLLERVACNTATPAEVWEWIKALNAENEPSSATAGQQKGQLNAD